MQDGKTYLIKQKIADKNYATHGNIKQNDKGYWGLGLKITPELKALVNGIEDGKWLNLSIYEKRDAQPGQNG